MGSTIGRLWRVTTFGESHGSGLGAVIDGCPAGLPLSADDIQRQLDRRRPGQSDLTTQRDEADAAEIISGVEAGRTLGTPIGILIRNTDSRPVDYREMRAIPRPSHADYTYLMKYGYQTLSGGGRASARETAARVAAGAVAELYLKQSHDTKIVAWVDSIGDIEAGPIDGIDLSREKVDAELVRCPDAAAAARMISLINEVKDDCDSIGGTISCVCTNVPPGWGEPVFDKLESELARAMLSIPATKGFEIGSGFAGTRMRGSAHNDPFISANGHLATKTNNAGGVLGGISSGMPVLFRVAFKPVATIGRPQETVDFSGQPVVLEAKGRHDPCVLPRAVPIVESMAALVLADLALQQRAQASE